MKKPIYFYVLIWLYGGLSVLDVILTQIGINLGFSEGNYLSKLMLGKYNIFGLYIIHFFEILIMAFFNNYLFKKSSKIQHIIMMSILNTIKLIVVIWNIKLIIGR
jgi:hypothetical protein